MAQTNRLEATRLTSDTGFLFLNDPAGLLFAVSEILYWLEREEPDRMVRLAGLLTDGRDAEACFQAQALLRNTSPKPLQVSVLIPTFNRVGLLTETIEALLCQSRKPDEILVIDNGSTDATCEYLEQLAATHKHFRWVREDVPGIVAARNRAVHEADANSSVVLFIDDDCIAPVDWVAHMMLPFEYDSEIVSCGGGISFRADDCTPWGDFYRQKYQGATAELVQ